MKKLLVLPLLFSFLLFASCLKENHSVCFRNDYSQAMYNVTAGTTKIGTVINGKTSPYYAISAGSFTVGGVSSGGQTLSGSGSVTGRGTHKWTIILSSAGTLSIVKDK